MLEQVTSVWNFRWIYRIKFCLCFRSTYRVSEPRECDREREYRHLLILLLRGESKHTGKRQLV